jgi:hypothetical protein
MIKIHSTIIGNILNSIYLKTDANEVDPFYTTLIIFPVYLDK